MEFTKYKDLIKDLALRVWAGALLFQQKKMTIVIAASTFFTILCALPLLLFSLDLLSSYVMTGGEFNSFALKQVWAYLPFIDESLKLKIHGLLNAKSVVHGTNIVNFIFLLISSTGLFRVILIGLHILTEKKFDRPLKLYGKGVLAAGFLFFFFMAQFLITPILFSVKELLMQLSLTSFGQMLNVKQYLDSMIFQSWTEITQFIFFAAFFFVNFKILFGKRSKKRDLFLGTGLMLLFYYDMISYVLHKFCSVDYLDKVVVISVLILLLFGN